MTTYLVGNSEEPLAEQALVFIMADTEQQARELYAHRVGIHDPTFQEHIYEKMVNASLAEKFWLQTKEEQSVFNQRGDVIASKSTFKGRVRTFFKAHPQFADLYLEHFFSNAQYPDIQPFPEGMLVHIWLHLKDWTRLVILDVDQIPTFP